MCPCAGWTAGGRHRHFGEHKYIVAEAPGTATGVADSTNTTVADPQGPPPAFQTAPKPVTEPAGAAVGIPDSTVTIVTEAPAAAAAV